MPYGETKVYFDGSHYIAIPHTTNPKRRRRRVAEEGIQVMERDVVETEQEEESVPSDEGGMLLSSEDEAAENTLKTGVEQPKKESRRMTRKELFEELYRETLDLKRAARRTKIIFGMRPYFENEEKTERYVDGNLERKQRNLICRRIRLTRKANLQEFNYFCTFTYDGAIHTEDSFKKDLKATLRNFCFRKGWKFIGVWERSPEKKRLHFHGLFYVPEGTMPSVLEEKTDYSFHTHKRETIHQSLYFLRRFGRNDFERIEDRNRLGDAMAYLMKYIEKTGEKIVYSKGLPQYFITDIMDDDVVCRIGQEDKKLLLFDDFSCWDEGEYMGQVSKETIEKLRKSN